MTTIASASAVAVVVNDDPTQLALLCGLAREAGLEPMPFAGAGAALGAVDHEAPPRLIVTDLHMPDIDGWRFCRLLRSSAYAAFNKVPILVVSATSANEYPERIVADTGANAILPMPVDGKEFVAQVRALLEGEARTRALEESYRHYRDVFEGISDAAFVHELDENGQPGRFLEVNEAACRRLGYTRQELLSLTPRDIADPVEFDRLADSRGRLGDQGSVLIETVHVAKGGQKVPVEGNIRRITYLGRPAALSISRDITERKQMESNLRRRDALMDAVARTSGLLLTSVTPAEALGEIVRVLGEASEQDRSYYFSWRTDPATGAVRVSLRHEWVGTGITPQQGNPDLQELPFDQVAPYSCERLRRGVEVCARVRDLPESERAVLEPQGILSLLLMPILVNGAPEGFFGFDNCRTESAWTAAERSALAVVAVNLGAAIARSRAELALRESEADLQAILANTTDIIASYDREVRLVAYNQACREAYRRLLGIEIQPGLRTLDLFPESQRGFWVANNTRALAGESFSVEFELPSSADGPAVFESSFHPIRQGTEVLGFSTTTRDITERKRAETENKALQVRLAQAQKMESVGRLAGGVAHDFNNMLQAILSHTSLALMDLPPHSQARDSLLEIEKSAQRSADLTRQLLAFARKQTIAPKVLDLNETIAGMLNMLRRLIGESIELVWMPGADLGGVNMDPSQVDQILANLAVNARDAIGGAIGKVTIETDSAVLDEAYVADHPEARAGRFVRLTVSDNGSGMSPEVRAHLFEPFFTTKALGQGTGLGLATVYGIVKQNTGFINVYSEPGRGTTLQIHLPRHAAEPMGPAAEAPVPVPVRGEETILLVEDEPAILRVTRRLLENLGYQVLAARTPREAMRLAGDHAGRIHLLLTDVVMPEMNGRDLARNLQSRYPDLKRLFMSGYTANVIVHHGVLDPGVHFIQKPFSIRVLADKVREALESRHPVRELVDGRNVDG
jgi:PAS domain S-box-containing protein